MKYYVNCSAASAGCGTKEHPFRTIQQAASATVPGDEVIVAPGIYRERVNPARGGTAEKRITYRSEVPLGAHITGAEVTGAWEQVEGSVYTTRVSNGVFTDRNPFKTLVRGDWFIAFMTAHTGDIYLNGKSMYEVLSLEDVKTPPENTASWDPDFTRYVWYCEQDNARNETVFFANFGEKDPNRETVEYTVRESCFAPEQEGIGYITFSGFTVSKAGTQWAPPTAYQEGMIAPHWSRGWIIEDCEVFESKCSGISLGKYLQPENDNKWLKWKYKDGTQTERDCICQAQREGWTKENIGSHIIRRCNIHDCGQTGIVGHMGGVFSLIEDNHIHHINNKQNLAGAEIGGIKMHAAIDVIYRRNHIHHCTRGLWLDWQAQGTRVTQNIFHDNTIPKEISVSLDSGNDVGEDVFIEVSHGPTLLDNNIFLSEYTARMATQGVAMVHNIIAGGFKAICIGTDNGALSRTSPRYTPYHVPHRTEVAGFMTFLHGDNKFFNNIFIQQEPSPQLLGKMAESKDNVWDDCNVYAGLHVFDDFKTFEEWNAMFEGYCGMGSPASDRYYEKLPVWAAGNVYFNGARPWAKETDAVTDTEHPVTIGYREADGRCYLDTNLYSVLSREEKALISTDSIAMAFEPEQKYENPDGTPIVFREDFFGELRCDAPIAGPFARPEEADRALF